MKHGLASTYTNYRCRCDECRRAQTLATRRYRKSNPQIMERTRARVRAEGRAFRELRRRHALEWSEIFLAEIAKEPSLNGVER